MSLNDFLAQGALTTALLATAAWLSKKWVTHKLEDLHLQNSHDLALKLENVRAEWAKDVARLNVHESYLHKKRVKLIEQLYSEMIEAEFSLQNFLMAWPVQHNQDEKLARGYPADQLVRLKEDMRKRGNEFCEKFTNISAMLHKNALYFDDTFIDWIRTAYQPHFDVIVNLDYEQLPEMPINFRAVISLGQAPRKAVIDRFRSVLGVA